MSEINKPSQRSTQSSSRANVGKGTDAQRAGGQQRVQRASVPPTAPQTPSTLGKKEGSLPSIPPGSPPPTLPGAKEVPTAAQAAAIRGSGEALKQEFERTIYLDRHNTNALLVQVNSVNSQLTPEDKQKVSQFLGQRTPEQMAGDVNDLFSDSGVVFDKEGNFNKRFKNLFQKEGNDWGALKNPEGATKEQFSLFTLLLLLMELQGKNWQLYDKMAHAQQKEIEARFDRKAQLIMEKAGVALATTLTAASVSMVVSGIGLGFGVAAAKASGNVSQALSSTSYAITQLGQGASQFLQGTGKFVEAGWDVGLSNVERDRNIATYRQDQYKMHRNRIQSELDRFLGGGEKDTDEKRAAQQAIARNIT